MTVQIDRLRSPDLQAALAIQCEIYPDELIECSSVFSSRLALSNSYCLAAKSAGQLTGYLIAHGWWSNSPPQLGTVLTSPAPSEVLYVHDLGVSRYGRGQGLGAKLVNRALAMASSDGVREAQLIAVRGADAFWRRLSFLGGTTSSEIESKLRSYGPNSVWMTREIG